MTNSTYKFSALLFKFSLTIVLTIVSFVVQGQPVVGLEIDTATKDGIRILGAGDDGIQIENCSYGVYVDGSDFYGILVQDVENEGVGIVNASGDGLEITRSGGNGITIGNSGGNGIESDGGSIGIVVKNTMSTGMSIQGAQGGGLDIIGTGGDGIYVLNATNFAGNFQGNVNVSGTLSKGMGTFKIDHPVDPENKFLYHSFVESPDMMNIYNGLISFDQNGEAIVTLPDYFEALNQQFRYQLTPIGGFAPLYIKKEIEGNKFIIAGGAEDMKVSWHVTGIRHDPLAKRNRVKVEVEKSSEEKGLYLHPEAYQMPEEKGLSWKKHLELKDQKKSNRSTRNLKN